jgi:stage V sporulation protein T
MQATGIIRRIDDLGRIVIPREIRRQLKIGESDPLEIFLSRDGEIILKPYRTEYTLRKADDWEELEDPQGKVVAQGHRLSVEEILSAVGVEFQIEEIEEED